MSDQAGSDIEQSGHTALYGPAPEGGLEASSGEKDDYRQGLRSRRWNAAPLENPEVEKTDPRLAVVAIVVLGFITLTILVAGYGSGLWSLPS